MSNDTMVPIDVVIIAYTNKAILVNNIDDEPVWLPLSQIELEDDNLRKGQEQEILVPDWLVQQNNLE